VDRCSVFLSHTLEYVSTYAHRTATGHINLTQRNLNATVGGGGGGGGGRGPGGGGIWANPI
jgi:hypothetical protein